jgi:hypothetical protein
MSLDKKFLLKALLQHNYFPSQSKDKEELPPILSSKSLTPKISEKLAKLSSRKEGYDQVEYKLTRYNNVPRPLSIPHPIPYTQLCHSLHDNWGKLEYITQTENSLIIPKKHSDGRIIIMDYENIKEVIKRHITSSFNNKFYVNTDISNFYPSIYSHSIPWALVGFEKAKEERGRNIWFNQIDKYQRLIKRNETNGVPTGPATSNIISELILARIDKKLNDEGFEFTRLIDDYAAYFDTYEKAEKFIRRLSEELSGYKLLLNIKKTVIGQLPSPSSPEWIADLTTRIPSKKNTHPTNIIRFLDYAVTKQAICPDGSVLKYAVKCIVADVEGNMAELLLQYLLSLCIKYPILLPSLNILFEKITFGSRSPYTDQLLNMLNEYTINKRSDAMTWTLYYLNKFSQSIPREIAKEVISSKDCIPILFLYLSKQHDKEVIGFCNSLDKNDFFLLDQYWLLLYQLFFDGKISNPYNNDNDKGEGFNILKKEGVSFIESR